MAVNAIDKLQFLSFIFAVLLCYAKRGICRRRVSVCLCVCLSHSGIVSKWLNVGSPKQRRMIAHDSSFLKPQIMAKFERDHPLRRRQMQVGWVKIGHFQRTKNAL